MQRSRFRKPPAMYRQDIYLAESSLGLHKIGVSQFPYLRVRQLSVPGVLDMKLLHTVPAMFARKTERLVHDALREYRVNSEWFKLPDDVVQALCEAEGEHDLLALCGTFSP
ncbi:MAG TPA: GIY-YIG nuclease family protein [Spirillospora sp.]|nr:GIY-YIG nuclease family protein [Spirillospora sp.]